MVSVRSIAVYAGETETRRLEAFELVAPFCFPTDDFKAMKELNASTGLPHP